MTDQLFQQRNQCSQLDDSLLQPSNIILAGLEGGLLETRQHLEIHHTVSQEKDLLRTTVDTVVCRLPLPREDDIILLDGVLDYVGRSQHLLSMLLGVSLNTTDLRCVGSPLHLSIVHLRDEC